MVPKIVGVYFNTFISSAQDRIKNIFVFAMKHQNASAKVK
jgi:hypothetical protein